MLNFFRSSAGSWFVKGILGIIILSFGIWGISGAFQWSGTSHLVAKVGDVDVTKAVFAQELKFQLANVQKETGKKISLDDLYQMGLVHQILESKINEILLHLEINRLNVMTPDKLVLDVIKQDPLFQENGQFSREKFDRILAANRLNERYYINEQRQKIAQVQILSAISAGGFVPHVLLESFFTTFYEKRKISIAVPKVQVPSDKLSPGEIEKFYEANKEKFRTPEYRTFKALILNPDEFTKNIRISETELQEIYEQQKEDFYEPEKRDALMIPVQNETEAAQVRGWLKAGQLKNIKDAIPLQYATKGDLLEEIAAQVFTLPAGEMSKMIDSAAMGQKFVIYVQKIYPGKLKPLSQVRKQVQEELRHQKALDMLATISKTLEDKIAAGASLKDVANEYKLRYVEITGCDRRGLLKNGQKAAGGINEEMLKTVFDTPVHTESPMVEVEDGEAVTSFIIRTESVEPSQIQELKEIYPTVKKLLGEKLELEDSISKVQLISAQLKEGKKLEEILKTVPCILHTFTLDPADPKSHDKMDKRSLFALFSVGEKESMPIEFQGQYALGLVTQIIPANANADKSRLDMIKKVLLMDTNKELVRQYFMALKAKHGVKIYEDSLSSLVNAGGEVAPTMPVDM